MAKRNYSREFRQTPPINQQAEQLARPMAGELADGLEWLLKFATIEMINAHAELRQDWGTEHALGSDTHYLLCERFALITLSDAEKNNLWDMAEKEYPGAGEEEIKRHCRFAAYNLYIEFLAENGLRIGHDGKKQTVKELTKK